MPPENLPLDLAIKTLWEASRWPGSPTQWQNARRRLDQLQSVRSSGVLHGPQSVRKSYLIHPWNAPLAVKEYRL